MAVGPVRRTALLGLAALALASQAASTQAARTAIVPRFGHVVVIVFENKGYGDVIGNGAAPVFGRLARRSALLTNYDAVAHPSLPNYLALASGSTNGISDDCTDCTVSARTLVDTLESARRTWKTYAEGLPKAGFTGARAGRYAKKHVPFLYFRDVLASPARLTRVVPLSQLGPDLARRALPDFSLVVPDLCHDMHDCSVATGDAWLGSFLPAILRSPEMKDGVVFVLFDEASKAAGRRATRASRRPLLRSARPLRSPADRRGCLESSPPGPLGHSAADHGDLAHDPLSPQSWSGAGAGAVPPRRRRRRTPSTPAVIAVAIPKAIRKPFQGASSKVLPPR